MCLMMFRSGICEGNIFYTNLCLKTSLDGPPFEHGSIIKPKQKRVTNCSIIKLLTQFEVHNTLELSYALAFPPVEPRAIT